MHVDDDRYHCNSMSSLFWSIVCASSLLVGFAIDTQLSLRQCTLAQCCVACTRSSLFCRRFTCYPNEALQQHLAQSSGLVEMHPVPRALQHVRHRLAVTVRRLRSNRTPQRHKVSKQGPCMFKCGRPHCMAAKSASAADTPGHQARSAPQCASRALARTRRRVSRSSQGSSGPSVPRAAHSPSRLAAAPPARPSCPSRSSCGTFRWRRGRRKPTCSHFALVAGGADLGRGCCRSTPRARQ